MEVGRGLCIGEVENADVSDVLGVTLLEEVDFAFVCCW